MKRGRKRPVGLGERIARALESLPGGMLFGISPERYGDWGPPPPGTAPEVWEAVLARRAEAERVLARMTPVLEEMASDPSVPQDIGDMAKVALRMAKDDRWAPEGRGSFIVKFLADPRRYVRALERGRGPRLPPPRKGALPAVDDTPWAPRRPRP